MGSKHVSRVDFKRDSLLVLLICDLLQTLPFVFRVLCLKIGYRFSLLRSLNSCEVGRSIREAFYIFLKNVSISFLSTRKCFSSNESKIFQVYFSTFYVNSLRYSCCCCFFGTLVLIPSVLFPVSLLQSSRGRFCPPTDELQLRDEGRIIVNP